MIYDENFIKALSQQKNKTIYAKIIALSDLELPIDYIEGEVTGGNINIDGKSAVRRTCSINMVSHTTNINDYYWTIKNKFKLEIGLTNLIDNNQPDIIWFPQGIFVITQFSNALSAKNYNISISGKDKMCLLNGEISGSLNSKVDFGKINITDKDGNQTTIDYPVKQIIREMVHEYGNEPFSNIIIKNMDDPALQLQQYRYEKPLYIYRNQNGEYINGTLDEKQIAYIYDLKQKKFQVYFDGTLVPNQSGYSFQDDKKENLITYDPLLEDTGIIITPTPVFLTETDTLPVFISKIEYGDTAGYVKTDLTYPGDLIGNAGQSLTSILDKIKNMLGNYEYFYNLNGQFVFQKKEYLKKKIVDGEDKKDYSLLFAGNDLLLSFRNSPDLKNIRNDYTIWGTRSGVSGKELPIHARYAIDVKPMKYHSFTITEQDAKFYGEYLDIENFKPKEGKLFSIEDYDWRELIYQMALDYRKCNQFDDFEIRLANYNRPYSLYPLGKTGYEQYYVDMLEFWRELYNPNAEEEKKEKIEEKKAVEEKRDKESDPKILRQLKAKIDVLEKEIKDLDKFYGADAGENKYWNKEILSNPEEQNFAFDFLDTDGETSNYSVKAIGARPKVDNNKSVKSIFYRKVPNIIFGPDTGETGYRHFNLQGVEEMFSPSAQGRSAKDYLDDMLENHTHCNETVTLGVVPIYCLEPNSVIYVNDYNFNIHGNYIISKISIPLTYNGTMNITAIKDNSQT